MFARALASGRYHEEDGELGGESTFALATLREVEKRTTHPLALAGAFGDAALLARLAPFRRMRESLLAMGYAFVPGETLTIGEVIAPELRLLDALRRRRLPFLRMGVGFEEILAKAPHARFDDVGLVKICLGNNTSHEGAHATVYEIAREKEGELAGRRLVEALVAGEAFAMAFEFWLALLVTQSAQRSTPIFFALNAAQNPFLLSCLEDEAPGALERVGRLAIAKPREVMKLFGAAALVANVRPRARGVRDDLVAHLSRYAALDEDHFADARVLTRAALSLDDGFRSVTAPTFFRYCDLERGFDELLALPLEHHFAAGSVFHDYVTLAIERMSADAAP